MARFGYKAVDRYGELRTGQIEASGRDEARAKLAAMGLKTQDAVIEPVAEEAILLGRLSPAEAAQLGGQVADLARSQLPLGPGLRAMAEEFPRGPAPGVLRRLADRIDAGMSLTDALEAEGPRVPEHIRCLLSAAERSGRFAEVIDEMVAVERTRLDVRQRMRLLFAYPSLLFVAILALYLLSAFITPQFNSIYRDFGTDLPEVTRTMLVVCSPLVAFAILATVGLCVLVVLLAIRSRTRVAWVQGALYRLPIVGPIWRFRGLAEFCRLMGLLVELHVPLPQALRAVAAGVREGDLRAAANMLAQTVESGVPFSDAMARLREFPATFKPLFQWGEKTPNLADAFRGSALMCEGRLRFQSLFGEAIVLPMMLLVLLLYVAFFVIALMLPMMMLLRSLAG